MTIAPSRYKTRRIVVQCLYSWAIRKERPNFSEMLNNLWMPEYRDALDLNYFSVVTEGVAQREAELAHVLKKYAPKFDISWMPAVNVMTLYVAIYEILYWHGPAIPTKVSIDEALEISRLFSDESGKTLVNGILNGVLNDRDALLAELEQLPQKDKRKPFFGEVA